MTHSTTESNTLQGYVKPMVDVARGFLIYVCYIWNAVLTYIHLFGDFFMYLEISSFICRFLHLFEDISNCLKISSNNEYMLKWRTIYKKLNS